MIAFENNFLKVEHSTECSIPGYLIVLPKEPVFSLSELSDQAQQQLFKIMAVSQQIIQTVIQPERIYILSFGEVMPRLHFHLFPRTRKMLADFNLEFDQHLDYANGPLMFDWARKKYQFASQGNLDMIQKINHSFVERNL